MISTVEESKKAVENILARARKEKLKGRYYIYTRYKSELLDVCLSSSQLEQATIDLARALRV